MQYKSIDIFCRIIDNFGDVGIAYRFAKELKLAQPACAIRLFVSDLGPLKSVHPVIDPLQTIQEHDGVVYVNSTKIDPVLISELGTADVLVEAMGCEIPEEVLQKARQRNTLIVNLEYLSAEKWIKEYHMKPSLLPQPTLKKYFYMPGFTLESGGVIINSQVERIRQSLSDNRIKHLNSRLKKFGIALTDTNDSLFGSIFTYVRGFDTLLSDLRKINKNVYLFIFGRKSRESIIQSLNRARVTSLSEDHYLVKNTHVLMTAFLPQTLYDQLLCITDFNFVRGEDSFVRAILSGKPFIWNAYLQENIYHRVKVEAFLEVFKNYFDDTAVFKHYSELLLEFNQAAAEQPVQTTHERYGHFFSDLNKINLATGEMSYFIRENCNLVKKFTGFLNQIQMETIQ
jgi:uncharacterized repeat protein (TIGR03837 family)